MGFKKHFSYCFYPFSQILDIRMDFYSVFWGKNGVHIIGPLFSHLFSFVEMDLGAGNGRAIGMGWDRGW